MICLRLRYATRDSPHLYLFRRTARYVLHYRLPVATAALRSFGYGCPVTCTTAGPLYAYSAHTTPLQRCHGSRLYVYLLPYPVYAHTHGLRVRTPLPLPLPPTHQLTPALHTGCTYARTRCHAHYCLSCLTVTSTFVHAPHAYPTRTTFLPRHAHCDHHRALPHTHTCTCRATAAPAVTTPLLLYRFLWLPYVTIATVHVPTAMDYPVHTFTLPLRLRLTVHTSRSPPVPFAIWFVDSPVGRLRTFTFCCSRFTRLRSFDATRAFYCLRYAHTSRTDVYHRFVTFFPLTFRSDDSLF